MATPCFAARLAGDPKPAVGETDGPVLVGRSQRSDSAAVGFERDRRGSFMVGGCTGSEAPLGR